MKKIIRVTTVPISLGGLLKGQLKFMSKHYKILGISAYGGGVLNKVGSEEGIKVIPVEMTRKITPIKDLKAVMQLYKIFKQQKPFVVHSHTPKAGTVSMIAAKLAGVPHRLHTIAGLPLMEAKGIKRFVLNWVEKLTYACATKIYPNSFGLKEIILNHKFTSLKKLKVIGNGSSNGIDTNHFDPSTFTENDKSSLKKILKIKSEDFVFVFVGRLVKDKGINELIHAFQRLIKNHPDTKLLLVGSYERKLDPLEKKTEDFIATSKNAIAVGWQSDVRPYLAISNCLVFPSYREGFPNVVMQAGAMGLYSIVTDINGCNEIITASENGTIIPAKSIEHLSKVMKKILNNKEKYKDSRKYREMILNRYEQDYVWKQILKEYQSIEN